ncbi:hypothetical protein CFBP6600_36660 [Xanthomonas arboricola pv. corylina]|nr:hypothetical protein CFBP6600_36660 [Xanthomonas arboricola pv. corylina]CAE6834307.1 hypothetical protein CFBP6600_36660 [Xanthomonas arboricola pv. corylina]
MHAHSGLLIDHTDRRSGRHPSAAAGYLSGCRIPQRLPPAVLTARFSSASRSCAGGR